MPGKPTYEELEQRIKELEGVEFERKRKEKALREQVLHQIALMDASLDGIAIIDQTHRVRQANKRFAQMLGYTLEEVLGLHTWDWEAKMTEAQVRANFIDLSKTQITFETCHRRKDGTIYDAEVTACGAKLGEESMVLTIARDITERKIIEDKLKNSLSLLEATLESTADGILVVNTQGKIERFNSKFAKMWMIPEEILHSQDDDKALEFVLAQLKHPEVFLNKVKKLYASQKSSSFDVLEFIDGRIFERYSQPQRVGDVVVGRVWSFRDVTESRNAEKALRESEAKYRLIAKNTADLISVLDMDLHFTYVSPASIRLRGFTTEEAMAQPLEQVLTPESMRAAISVFEEEMLKESSGTADIDRTRTLELEQYKKDGSTVWMEVSLRFLRDKDGKPVQILAVTRDISDRKRAEKALRESEERFRANFQYAPVGMAVIDTETKFMEVNRQICQILGYAPGELIGRSFNDFTHPEDRDGGRRRWRELLDGEVDFNQAEKRYIH